MVALIILAIIAGIAGYVGYYNGKKEVGEQKQRELEEWKRSAEASIESKRRELQNERYTTEFLLQQKERELREQEQQTKSTLQQEKQRIEEYLDGRELAFHQGFCKGRKWLAELIAESEQARDYQLEQFLYFKQQPALKAAEAVKKIKAEKRQLNSKLKFYEYQLRSYKEYFPFLEDYEEAILDELIPLSGESDNVEELQAADPVIQFLDHDEYEKLSSVDKSQRALERYLKRSKDSWEIGRLYERYLGYLYENDGWKVTYEGAIKGYEDFGRDLICRKGDTIRIVQAKRWHSARIIREKHIFQLYGTACLYKRKHKDLKVSAEFCSTTGYSEEARDVASALTIKLRTKPHSNEYPMIKCNINPTTKDRIYHLPFDQQYDRTVIGTVPGECYVKTAREAEELGFRRAWRYHGPM